MAKPTSTATLEPPVIPTGQELFNVLMGNIEPELTTEGVKLLMEKYKNETPTEELQRRRRYELAYQKYEEAYTRTMNKIHDQVDHYRRVSFTEVEDEDRAEDSLLLNAITKSLSV